MKILICEHEEIMLTAIEFRMRKAGFKAFRSKTEQETYEKIKKEKPGFIVINMALPNTDMLAMIKNIRFEHNSDAPIIMVTELEEADEMILEGFEIGANDFVTKPFKPAELVLRIRRIMQEKGIELIKEKIK